jgi:hydrogenase nickel incorporation protein HypB
MNVKILRNVLEANDQVASQIREQLAAQHITAINLISSPGAGKTSLLERTIPLLNGRHRVAVLEGDIATTRDSERIEKLGVPVVQLLTAGACHLEAPLVRRGLAELNLNEIDLLFIENVGNIACPAEFDLGETAKVGILSVTEGHDKPAKYPLLFHEVGALVLNKTDLLPYTDFNFEQFRGDFRRLNHDAALFEVSCKTSEGIKEWVHWIEHACTGELHFEPHTHSHDALADILQPHQHPHRQHHEGVVRG